MKNSQRTKDKCVRDAALERFPSQTTALFSRQLCVPGYTNQPQRSRCMAQRDPSHEPPSCNLRSEQHPAGGSSRLQRGYHHEQSVCGGGDGGGSARGIHFRQLWSYLAGSRFSLTSLIAPKKPVQACSIDDAVCRVRNPFSKPRCLFKYPQPTP